MTGRPASRSRSRPGRAEERGRTASLRGAGPVRAAAIALGLASVGLAFWIFGPALDGEFISDDLFYIEQNPYVRSLALESIVDMFDPRGEAAVWTLNYAPANLVALALEWSVFGDDPRGYHVVNVCLHLTVTALLILLWSRTGLSRGAAALAALYFLVHPANVETVAWIFQVKTLLSTSLALAALLCLRRFPVIAALLFGLGLLTKISAAFALPAAASMLWCLPGDDSASDRRGRVGLGLFVLSFCIVAWPVWQAIRGISLEGAYPQPDAFAQLRAMVAVGGRYLVMAASALNVSAFAKPAMDVSMTDPWWLFGAVSLAGLAARWLVVLRARDPEAIHWTIAAASFLPVSQIVPLPYPIADHYLYAILPGLIGGSVLALRGPLERLERAAALREREKTAARWRGSGWMPERPVHALVVAIVVLVCGVFAFRSHDRAHIWKSAYSASLDAAEHYPDGLEAHLIAAFHFAQQRDAVASAAELRLAYERGYRLFGSILENPAYQAVRAHPAFDAVIRDMAGWWIRRAREVEHPTQLELLTFANAHYVRGELDASIRLLERAAAVGGPSQETVLDALDRRQLERRLRDRTG